MKAPLFPGLIFSLLVSSILADDWPAYRANGDRSAVSSETLPAKLFSQWQIMPRHAPRTAWPLPGEETPRMHSDRAYHAVVAGDTLVYGNNVDNQVYAVHTRSGMPKWRFATEGAVRFAPMLAGGRAYFGSDDGHVYCVDIEKGTLIWKHRMGPSGERIIGRSRLVSLWPVRTGVLVEDDVVYAAAGVFPYEGLYIKAINAKTGKTVWANDTTGDQSWGQLYGGMSPQGYIVASDDTLFVPAGRSMPVAFDKRTGKFKRFLNGGGKTGGSWAVMDDGKLFAGNNNQGTDTKVAFDGSSGRSMGDMFARYPAIDMVLTKTVAYIVTQKGIYAINREANRLADSKVPALDKESGALAKSIAAIRKRHKAAADDPDKLKGITAELNKATARLSAIAKEKAALNAARVKWLAPRPGVGPIVVAGDALYAGGDGFVMSLEADTGKPRQEYAVHSRPMSFAVSGGRLFASMVDGSIHCLGGQPVSSLINRPRVAETKPGAALQAAGKKVLQAAGMDRGWCLIAGASTGGLAEVIAAQTKMNIVIVEADAKRRQAIRERLLLSGLLGSRVSVLGGAYGDLPDYFANLIVSERALLGEEVNLPVDELARVLRPAGGQLLLGPIKEWPLVSVQKIAAGLKANAHAASTVKYADDYLHFTRGKLKDAGSWTGLYGNTGNTSSTPDMLVKGPLGVLWYGEPGSEDMVDRHARAASPLAINGRLFMQGAEVVMAYDAYNGTFLWKKKIPGAVRVRVDVDGSNITATDDAIFVATHNRVLELDAQTGEQLREFPVPRKEGAKALRWGYIAVQGNLLIGSGATPLAHDYGYLWNVLTKDGEWVAEADAPKGAVDTLRKVKRSYPKPDDRAYDYFKRAGFHWHKINKFPGWLPDHNPSAVDKNVIMTSEKVFAYDLTTGKLLWEHEGESIPNISVVMGDDRIYFLKADLDERDKAQAKAATKANVAAGVFVEDREKDMKESDRDYRRVVCLDTKTGQLIWSRPYDLTGSGGTKLGLAYQSGKLLAFGHYSNHDEGPFNKGGLNWRRITVIDGNGGSLLWSKPLNYRRRPTIMGNTIYIEPRRCDLTTGDIQQRTHPITGKPVEWEFLRPGHSCGIVTATPGSLFFRSFSGAIVNTEQDSGLQLFGGMRPGCWNSMIPANGLLSMQEASAGCTCSYSLRTTVVLKNKPQKGHAEWAVFISQAATKPVQHLAVNFGAPGDMRDRDGRVWFGYPRPSTSVGQGAFRNYGVKLNLSEAGAVEKITRDWRGVTLAGTDKPWLFTSALTGVTRLKVPLLEADDKGTYTVRLGFTPLAGDKAGDRVFDVRLQGQTVLSKFDAAKIVQPGAVTVREFKGVNVTGNLIVDLTPPELKGPAVIDVHPKLHHLGDNVVEGWKESTVKPEGFELKIPFEFKGADDDYILAITQQDVHNGWLLELNGRDIGRLRRDTARQVTQLRLPKGVLKQGANLLVVKRSEKSTDDIQVGYVQLQPARAVSSAIHSLEVIREDGKTAAK